MLCRNISTSKLKSPRRKADHKGAIVLSYTASTSAEDRYGDIIKQGGWQLDSFRKNPVVLWQHRADQLPIGKGIVSIHNDKLLIDIEFDTDERSAEIARKAKNGFLNAVSVGFNPSKGTPRKELDPSSPFYGDKGMYFEATELLEVSLVTIPANGQATAAKDLTFGGITKQDIQEIVRSEMSNRPVIDLLMMHKHILEIREEEDRFIVHFAKEEPTEEVEIAEDEEMEDLEEEEEEIEELYMQDDEEEEEEPKEKDFNYFELVSDQDLIQIYKNLQEE